MKEAQLSSTCRHISSVSLTAGTPNTGSPCCCYHSVIPSSPSAANFYTGSASGRPAAITVPRRGEAHLRKRKGYLGAYSLFSLPLASTLEFTGSIYLSECLYDSCTSSLPLPTAQTPEHTVLSLSLYPRPSTKQV